MQTKLKIVIALTIAISCITLTACNHNQNVAVNQINLSKHEQHYQSQDDLDTDIGYQFDEYEQKHPNRNKFSYTSRFRKNPFGFYKHPVYAYYDNGDERVNFNRNRLYAYELNNINAFPKIYNKELYQQIYYLLGDSKNIATKLRSKVQLKYLLSKSALTTNSNQIDYYKSARDSAMSYAYKQYILGNASGSQILQNKSLNSWHCSSIKNWINKYIDYHYRYILKPVLNNVSIKIAYQKQQAINNLANDSNIESCVVNGKQVLKIKHTNLYVSNAGYQFLAGMSSNDIQNEQENVKLINLHNRKIVAFTEQFGRLIPSQNVQYIYMRDSVNDPNDVNKPLINKNNKYTNIVIKPNTLVAEGATPETAKLIQNCNINVVSTKNIVTDLDNSDYFISNWQAYKKQIKQSTYKNWHKNQQIVNDYESRNDDNDPAEDNNYHKMIAPLTKKQQNYLLEKPYYLQYRNTKYYIVPFVINNKFYYPEPVQPIQDPLINKRNIITQGIDSHLYSNIEQMYVTYWNSDDHNMYIPMNSIIKYGQDKLYH